MQEKKALQFALDPCLLYSATNLISKGQFSFQSQGKAMPKNAQTTAQFHSSHTLADSLFNKFRLPASPVHPGFDSKPRRPQRCSSLHSSCDERFSGSFLWKGERPWDCLPLLVSPALSIIDKIVLPPTGMFSGKTGLTRKAKRVPTAVCIRQII